MVSWILPKKEQNSLSWASSLLSIVSFVFWANPGDHRLLSRFTDLYLHCTNGTLPAKINPLNGHCHSCKTSYLNILANMSIVLQSKIFLESVFVIPSICFIPFLAVGTKKKKKIINNIEKKINIKANCNYSNIR